MRFFVMAGICALLLGAVWNEVRAQEDAGAGEVKEVYPHG